VPSEVAQALEAENAVLLVTSSDTAKEISRDGIVAVANKDLKQLASFLRVPAATAAKTLG